MADRSDIRADHGGLAVTPDAALALLRAKVPLVQCITNYVAMGIAANVCLGAGASPAMIHAEEEAADFARAADALTVNIGTLSPSWCAAMESAAEAARGVETPWVFDPVGHFVTPYRREATARLMALGPAIIRGNASEIKALSGGAFTGKGADSGDDVAGAEACARRLSERTGAVIAVTGDVDFVTDGTRAARISGGSSLMPHVTALGCALTALMGGYSAVAPPFDAALGALVLFAKAGARAGEKAAGPGSFAVHFLDALHSVQPDDLAKAGGVSWV